MRLAVRERILLFLLETGQDKETLEVPGDLTQEGLAEGTWIQRRHVRQYVGPLMAEGLIRERKAHVRGLRQRRKVYDLTPAGRVAALRLRQELGAQLVRVKDATSTREMPLVQAVREAAGRIPFLQVVRHVVHGEILDLSRLPEGRSASFVEFLADAPRVDGFVGRERELDLITRETSPPRVFVVRGVAGIGKSWFGARACELLRGRRNLYWHRVRPWDTHHSLLAGLGDFLTALGRPRLRSVLARVPERAPYVLKEDLSGIPSYLVFDDVQVVAKEAVQFLSMLMEAIADIPEVRVLVLTRIAIPFFDRRDVLVRRLVHEIDLPGLRPEDFRTLMSSEDEAKAWAGAIREAAGHPLLIDLGRVAPRLGAVTSLRNLQRFLEEEIYRQLSDAERRMMKTAALYEVPVPREALFVDLALSHDVLLALLDKSLIRGVSDDSFEVHDTIREFFAAVLTPAERRELGKFVTARLRELAQVAFAQRKRLACVNFLANALRVTDSREDRVDLWEMLGDMNKRIGDLPAALIAYKEALKMAEDPLILARIHRKTASTLEDHRESAAAQLEIEASFRALGTLRGAERGWVETFAAHIAQSLGNWEEALNHADRAVRTFDEVDDPLGRAKALFARGSIETERWGGDPQVAEHFLRAALGQSVSTGEAALTAAIRFMLAWLAAGRLGDSDRAERELAAAGPLPEDLDFPLVKGRIACLRGWIELESRSDPAAAVSSFSMSAALAKKYYSHLDVLAAKHGLASVSLYQGRIDDAWRELSELVTESQALKVVNTDSIGFIWALAECSLLREDVTGFRRALAELQRPALSRVVERWSVPGQVLCGIDLLLRDEKERALLAFEEALATMDRASQSLEGSFAHAPHFYYGIALQLMGREAEAQEQRQRALEIVERNAFHARRSLLPRLERSVVELCRHAPQPRPAKATKRARSARKL